MRDQSEVADARLGLLAQSDPRNDGFKVEKLSPADAYHEPDIILDQGEDGSCVGFAFTHALRAQGWRHPSIDDEFAWGVYTSAQKIDPWMGGEYAGANPHMAGTSLLAGAKVLHHAGYFPEYRWASTVSQVRHGLVNGPGVLGCMWRNSMDNLDDNETIEVKGKRQGGHALLIAGVIGDLFILVNSWGSDWGNNGHAYIHADDLAKLLRDKVGQVVFPSAHESLAG